MLSTKTIENVTIYLGMPVVGAATALLTSKVATLFGRSFMQIGPQSLLLLGTIGAVHNFVSFYLAIRVEFQDDKYLGRFTKSLISGSVISGTFLVALSALAARVNLISAGLTPFGSAALIVTGFIGNYMAVKTADALIEQAKAGQNTK